MNLFISIFKMLFKIGMGFAIVIIIAEILFQFLPVKTGFKRPETITSGTPPHWAPNQSFTYSAGWRLDNPQTGWINNKGYPTPIDFNDGAEAVIVIGDSFVENQMNSWDESFMGRLEEILPYPVYAFGLSGAQAADYIGLAKHAAEKYSPKHMIILMQNGDLSGATEAYQSGHYYIENTNGDWSLEQVPYSYQNAAIRNFFKQSALLRYVVMNLQIQNKLKWPSHNSSKKREKIDVASRYAYMIDEICRLGQQGGYDITILTENEELSANQYKAITNTCTRMKHINVLAMRNGLEKEKPNMRLNHEPYDLHWNATMHKVVFESVKQAIQF